MMSAFTKRYRVTFWYLVVVVTAIFVVVLFNAYHLAGANNENQNQPPCGHGTGWGCTPPSLSNVFDAGTK